MDTTSGPRPLNARVANYLVLFYQVVILLSFLALPFFAVSYFRTPFLGVFLEHTMATNGVGPDDHIPEWTLFNDGLDHFGDQLKSLALLDANGSPVASMTIQPKRYSDVQALLANHFPGESVQATFLKQDGTTQAYTIALSRFPVSSQVEFFILPYLVGCVYLGISVWIFGLRRNETSGRAFAMFASSTAFGVGGLLDLYTTNHLTYLWVMVVPMVGASLFHLGLVFPQETRLVLRYPFTRWLSYVISGALAILNFSTLFNFSHPLLYGTVWKYSYIFTGVGGLFFVLMMLYRLYGSPSPVVRQQARTILVGAVAAFFPVTVWLLWSSVSYLNFNPYVFFLPLMIFPVTTGYTVLRYRLMRTDYLVGRGLLYVVLSLLAIGGYVMVAIGLSMIFGTTVSPDNPLLLAIAVFGSVLVLNPVRSRLQEIIDAIFFRGERAHQERISSFTRDVTNARDLQSIIRILREQIAASLLPGQLHIYVYDGSNDQYVATEDETGRLTSDIRFAANSVLPETLRKEQLPLFVDQTNIPVAVRPERGRLALLGAQLFVPMPGRDRLVGWIALGERLSGENYASHDIAFLETLGRQSAVAIERAQVLSNMERRVHELNVLARIAQGINITLSFDDILELIYAQTAQIIPGADFHLTLYNRTGQHFYYAFCLEDDERLRDKENAPLLAKTTLDQEVAVSRHAFFTQDYVSQCQTLGVNSPVKGLYAWLGVPLNTGTETIGTLSISSRDPSVSYTDAQLELLQAIADQAAGAIVKSRLLDETERRAQQLSILNVITRQLTSTLDLQPLLKSILENAVNILNCEAGSLFLVDEQTDELIFQVTVGPVASNLAGQRLPAGSGFVGKAVTNRQPVIVNDVQGSATWNAATDKQTGFITRAILAVPMEVKDRVIGVIEIINKQDGSPFMQDDQNLLSAFAGQAAVAIENARLYTLTDQELNARVEELSVMQRIDRELNASLEVNRAMRITLEWAMRQSRAEAGFIGIVQEEGIRLIADQGYQAELQDYDQEYMPVNHSAVNEALLSGLPQRVALDAVDGNRCFLNGTRSQLVVPIRRESNVIGLFLLESTVSDCFQQDAFNFLSRLSDHAAIAISNAQLYAEVQAANTAKSEFVSFVAHELKNPMTSIKGYSELLASGAVGPITDMQSNFLTTIRSNTERMKTIVEDLNDNSKIEAGRLRLEFQAVDVDDVVEEVIRSTKRQLEDKKQTVNIEIPKDLPKVWADRNRLIQVLVNLVSNAYKYTPEGGEIRVMAELSENTWDPDGALQVVHIWVKDNGIGISPEDQKKIFQKFFRSEDDQARKSPGTGLGLNITKSLVEMEGGRIWFDSEFRHGTTFHITIPISEN